MSINVQATIQYYYTITLIILLLLQKYRHYNWPVNKRKTHNFVLCTSYSLRGTYCAEMLLWYINLMNFNWTSRTKIVARLFRYLLK